MAQLNAGDVLAIVGGDVTRKPVLQCIGKRKEREEKRGRREERETGGVDLLWKSECSEHWLFSVLLLECCCCSRAPPRLPSRSAPRVLYSSCPLSQKRERECGSTKSKKREEERNSRVLTTKESFSSLSSLLFYLLSSSPLFSLLSGRVERVVLPCRGKTQRTGKGESGERGSLERGRGISLFSPSIDGAVVGRKSTLRTSRADRRPLN